MLNKLVKHNKLIAMVLVLAFVVSMGTPAWTEEPPGDPPETGGPADDAPDEEMSEPLRLARQCENPFACRDRREGGEADFRCPGAGDDCGKLFDTSRSQRHGLRMISSSGTATSGIELWLLDRYEYTGLDESDVQRPVRNNEGRVMLENEFPTEAGSLISLFDEYGRPTRNAVDMHEVSPFATGRGRLTQREVAVSDLPDNHRLDLPPDTRVNVRFYTGIHLTPVARTRDAGIFAVRDKGNGFVWWSNPINATHDPLAGTRPAQLSLISSPFVFRSGNPAEPGGGTVNYSNAAGSEGFTTALENIELITNGFRLNYFFPIRSTRVSMEVTLDASDNSVLVTIPHSSIVEEDTLTESGSVMLTMSLLNSFGSGSENSGYIVVPDGSGAVIDFNNGRTVAYTYTGQVYGRDFAVSQTRAPAVTQQVYLPTFGIVRNNGANALVAVAEKGAENAVIRAAVAGQRENNTSLNVAWFDFTMRTVDSFFIGTQNSSITIFETGGIRTGDISVRYFPLSAPKNGDVSPNNVPPPPERHEDRLSYVDVALAYRGFLENRMNVGRNAATMTHAPFYMTLNGGTVLEHSIMGFPVERQTAATTYAQALSMVETVRRAGVSNAVVTYNNFNTAGIRRQVSSNVHYSSLLGGRRDWNTLSNAANSGGYSLFPSMGFMDFTRSGRGYNFLRHSAREATRSRATQSRWELSFGSEDTFQDPWTVLAPAFFDDAMSSIIRSLNSEGISNISLDNATRMLYSDFSRNNPLSPYADTGFNRRDSVEILTSGFAAFNNAGISLMATQSANAYALPYVSHISNVPLFSSGFDMFSYDIPFYQIVISGLIPYTTKPFNENADLNRLTLLALSTGTPVHYEFIYENPNTFTDSDYNVLFYAHFDSWVDEAVAMYHMFERIIGDVSHRRIISHVRDPERDGETHIHETVFEGGTRIRVNLQTYEVMVNGNRVDTILRGGS